MKWILLLFVAAQSLEDSEEAPLFPSVINAIHKHLDNTNQHIKDRLDEIQSFRKDITFRAPSKSTVVVQSKPAEPQLHIEHYVRKQPGYQIMQYTPGTPETKIIKQIEGKSGIQITTETEGSPELRLIKQIPATPGLTITHQTAGTSGAQIIEQVERKPKIDIKTQTQGSSDVQLIKQIPATPGVEITEHRPGTPGLQITQQPNTNSNWSQENQNGSPMGDIEAALREIGMGEMTLVGDVVAAGNTGLAIGTHMGLTCFYKIV